MWWGSARVVGGWGPTGIIGGWGPVVIIWGWFFTRLRHTLGLGLVVIAGWFLGWGELDSSHS